MKKILSNEWVKAALIALAIIVLITVLVAIHPLLLLGVVLFCAITGLVRLVMETW